MRLSRQSLFCFFLLAFWLPLASPVFAGESDNSSFSDVLERLKSEVRDLGWIAFSAKTETGDWDLFRMRPDGSDRSPLTQTPEFTEAGVRFSPDGRKVFYYRMPKDTPLDNNTYGTFTLVLTRADGSEEQVLGEGYSWAAWGPDGDRIAFLNPKGIHILSLADRKIVRTVPRKGFVQQLSWSPDGRWFCATANGLGPYWAIGRIDAQTGALNAASETDRYNCTPDWFPDSNHIVYSRGIVPDKGGWAELWEAVGDGSGRRMLYAEENRHLYGGALSPDGRYLLFTRSVEDLGKVDHSQTRMAVIRLADAPMIGGPGGALCARFPEAKSGPCLDLGAGWEPAWTNTDP